jgi:hypothetical protein
VLNACAAVPAILAQFKLPRVAAWHHTLFYYEVRWKKSILARTAMTMETWCHH